MDRDYKFNGLCLQVSSSEHSLLRVCLLWQSLQGRQEMCLCCCRILFLCVLSCIITIIDFAGVCCNWYNSNLTLLNLQVLCVNEDVLVLKNVSRINERCLELKAQRGKSTKRQAIGQGMSQKPFLFVFQMICNSFLFVIFKHWNFLFWGVTAT